MTPSELLQAAADRLRDLAAAATDAPWEVESMNDHTFSVWSDGTGFSGEDEQLATLPTEADARWIAALSPAVAPDLSALLYALDAYDYGAARVIAQRLARSW